METKSESHTPQPPALYTQSDITARGRFSKSHLYNLIARNAFPQPVVRMGPRFTRWSAAQCEQWFADPSAFPLNAGNPTAKLDRGG